MIDYKNPDIKISYHALQRFQKRTGCKDFKKAKNSLNKIFNRSKVAFGYKHPDGTIELFSDKYRWADGWVLVVKQNKIITCFQANKERCLGI